MTTLEQMGAKAKDASRFLMTAGSKIHSTNNNTSLEVHHGYAVQARPAHRRLSARQLRSRLLRHEGNVKNFTNRLYGETPCSCSPASPLCPSPSS